MSVLMNAGNGTFAAQASHATCIDPAGLAIADMDGDGKPDLVVSKRGGNPPVTGSIFALDPTDAGDDSSILAPKHRPSHK